MSRAFAHGSHFTPAVRWLRHGFLAVLLLAAAACSDVQGPSGPGSYTVTVLNDAAPPGAALMELVGPGILAVESVDGSRVYATPLVGQEGLRIVVATPGDGPLSFRALVSDLALTPPQATVLEVVGLDNQPSLPPASYPVRVVRD